MSNKFLLAGLLGFLAGIIFNSIFHFGFAFTGFLSLLFLALLVAGYFSVYRGIIFVLAVFFLAFSFGFTRTELENYRYSKKLTAFIGEKIIVSGTIEEKPDIREKSTRLTVLVDEILLPNKIEINGEKISVITSLYPEWNYGDRISLSGELRPVENFSSNGIKFNYQAYLGKDGIFSEMVFPKISKTSSSNGNFVLEKLFFLNKYFSESVRRNITEPESSLAIGEILGEKHALPQGLLNDFKRAGLIHIVVLSGYNIALVSQFFSKIFSFLPLVFRASAGALAIVLFVAMSGGGASVIRAAIMALIALLGIATGRTYDAGRALFVAGFLMLLENPNLLLFDPSFELSFLATLGIIYLTPHFSFYIKFIRFKFLRELVAQTISTQVAVLPLLVYLSGQISIISLFANIFALPAIPLSMFFSALTGFFGLFGSIIALPFAFASWFLLRFIILVSKFFSELPFSVLPIGPVSVWVMFLAYLFLLVIYFLISRKNVVS